MKAKFNAALEWLNSKPGRKRTAALAVFVTVGILRAFNQTEWANTIEGLHGPLQVLVTSGDWAGLLVAVVGVADAKRKGNL